MIGLESGFYDLDSFTNGFQKSDLIIIAGRPSMGKTALSLNIALNITKNTNLPVLFFSFEMTKEQLISELRVGYAYDHNLNVLNNYRNNSHEISLGLYLRPKNIQMKNPRWF